MLANYRSYVIYNMPKKKTLKLEEVESILQLSGPQCAAFFGYDRKHWVKMRTRPYEFPVQDRLLFSIQAHLKLSDEEIAKLKKERLSISE
ncbi:MAG: hypothetical protein OEY58_19345 [Gammaproteobacteria bacterium]|nr:hypothetical protein [Gammaproteobacteria bacterium]